MSVPLTGDVELYLFATYSSRDNLSGGFYRQNNNNDSFCQTFSEKTLVDLNVRYQALENRNLTFFVGGNNVFATNPDDTIAAGQTRSGRIVDTANNVVIDFPGVFAYSRASAPFGFNALAGMGGVTLNFSQKSRV